MANTSTTNITITSNNEEDINEANIKILNNIRDGQLNPKIPSNSLEDKARYSGMEIEDYALCGNDTINIYGYGRWTSPDGFFIELCKEFDLSMKYWDSEVGCNFHHRVDVESGKVILNKEYLSLSAEAIEDKGIDTVIEEQSWRCDEEDWETKDEHREAFELFSSFGVSIDILKEDYHWQ